MSSISSETNVKYATGALAGGAVGAFVGSQSGVFASVGGTGLGLVGGAVSMKLARTDPNGLGNVMFGSALGVAGGIAAGIVAGGSTSLAAASCMGVLGGAAGLGIAHQFTA